MEWLVSGRYAGRSRDDVETMDAWLAAVRDRVLDRALIGPDDVVLDIGTGMGLLALGALERVGADGTVVCLDVSVDCLDELRAVSADPRLSFLVGSAEVLPLPDASADVVLTRSVLIYVKEKAEAAREFFRVLRPGGRISLFEPVNRRNTQLWELVDFGPLREQVIADFEREWPRDDPMLDFDEHDLQRAFEQAGFAELEPELDQIVREIRAETLLHAVGAPGHPSLVERWRESFSAGEVEELIACVRAAGPLTTQLPLLYLAGTKA